MAKNKKIRNATEVVVDNIDYKSKLDSKFYKKLVSLGLNPEYEPEKIVLLEGFRPNDTFYIDGVPQITKSGDSKKVIDWTYTPDFVIKLGVHTFYIEAKGYPNDLWPYKRKMFLNWLQSQHNSHFFEVHNVRLLVKSVEIMKKIAGVK